MFRFLGFLTVAVGGYFAWRNRFAVQKFLESYGVKTPLDQTSIPNTLRSGISKATGSLEHGVNTLERNSRKAG